MCTYITSLNIHMYVHADIGKPLGKYSTIFAPVRRPKYVHMQLLNFGEKSKKKSPFAPSRFSIFPSVTYKSSAWNCHVFWSEASLDTPRFTDGFFMLLSKSREHRTFFVPFLFLITFRLHVCIKHAIRWSKKKGGEKTRRSHWATVCKRLGLSAAAAHCPWSSFHFLPLGARALGLFLFAKLGAKNDCTGCIESRGAISDIHKRSTCMYMKMCTYICGCGFPLQPPVVNRKLD